MDEEEKRKQSPDLVGTAQNARALYSLLRTARAALAAIEIVEFTPILVIILVGATTFILLLVLGGQATGTSEISSPPPTQAPSDVASLFKSTNNGDGISDPDFYNLLKDALSNPTYSGLITRGGVFNIEFFPSLDNFVGCQALVQVNTIKFYGLSLCNVPNQKYLASHEAGHIIENRNGRLYQSFPHSDLIQQDSGCYSSLGFLKSYFYAESGAGTNPFEESFAEAIALYLMPNERKPLTNFQNQCPNTYNWVRDNIFK